MIGVHVQPLAEDSSLPWIRAVAPADCFVLVRPTFDSTNTVRRVSVFTSLPEPTQVDRGIEFAMRHDMNLLRRLAD